VNWVVKFDELNQEYTDKALDLIAKYDKHKNDMLNQVYTKAYNLEYSIDKLKDEFYVDVVTSGELCSQIDKLYQIYREIKDEFENVVSEIKKFIYVIGPEIRELQNNMLVITSKFIKSNKDYNMLYKRIDVFSKNLINIAIGLDVHCIDETYILEEIHEDFSILYKMIEKKINKESEEEHELMEHFKQSQKRNYLKIFDYKEMINLAEEHEYEQIRQCEDIIIMQHKKTNKIVPIPVHELKYGLMLQIQKQIQVNKIS
jgi:SepF-like predicted cell division protein (DUF552 family)